MHLGSAWEAAANEKARVRRPRPPQVSESRTPISSSCWGYHPGAPEPDFTTGSEPARPPVGAVWPDLWPVSERLSASNGVGVSRYRFGMIHSLKVNHAPIGGQSQLAGAGP